MYLIAAIEKGIIAAAGVDVYEWEKPIFFKNHMHPIEDPVFEKLQSFSNILLTGHQAFLTNEALKGIAETTIANLTTFMQHGHTNNDLC